MINTNGEQKWTYKMDINNGHIKWSIFWHLKARYILKGDLMPVLQNGAKKWTKKQHYF